MKVHRTNGNCTILMGKYIIQTETKRYKLKKKNMEYKINVYNTNENYTIRMQFYTM